VQNRAHVRPDSSRAVTSPCLMSWDHRLEVFVEDPLVGRDANTDAWRGYFDSFPNYLIYPHALSERDGSVAILGHTTGSHLGLSDEEESLITLIWVADTAGESVSCWKLVEDTPANRDAWGLDVS